MAKRSFKIGERCVGGIIQVEITGNKIVMRALDYYSKKEVMSGVVMSNEEDAKWKADLFLSNLSTSFHADKVIKWIETIVKFSTSNDY